MKMYSDNTSKLENIAYLKRSLEEAEIIKSGMKLVLIDPSLDSIRKGEYEKAFMKLNDDIRDLKMMMGYVRKSRHMRLIDTSSEGSATVKSSFVQDT